jgi:hypothetical protein
MTNQEFLDVVHRLYGAAVWPKPLHLLKGLQTVQNGMSEEKAARIVGTTRKLISKLLRAEDPVYEVLGKKINQIDQEHTMWTVRILGQLLLGRCAEVVFEGIFKREMPITELVLKDVREGRTDTDYRLYNSGGRPIYRVNIKFHGSRFRRAPELVGLDPHNCFALATYKIYSALQKQEEEGLPYFFAVVGVSGLTGEGVGSKIPPDLLHAAALIGQAPRSKGKRDFEDTLVDYLVREHTPIYSSTLSRIEAADWYILSARRADMLLRDKLFDRVFALRIRNFSQAFRGAELDMHFSLSEDLTPLPRFLDTVKTEGLHKITTFLERGEF